MNPNREAPGSREPQPSSRERQRVAHGHLPRLSPESYRGRAFVHWTLTIENRAKGWLTPTFHHAWQLILLHASARYDLLCPAYALMPDHAHLLWLGTNDTGSDQRVAVEFLRKQLRPHLAPTDWQRQPHDNVLRAADREHGAFQAAAQYVFENPMRAGAVTRWQDYPYLGCCVPGYPEFDPTTADYWERFWRCYNYLIEGQGA